MEPKVKVDFGPWGVEPGSHTYNLDTNLCDLEKPEKSQHSLTKYAKVIIPWGGSRNGVGGRVLCALDGFGVSSSVLRGARMTFASRCNGYLVVGEEDNKSACVHGLQSDDAPPQNADNKWHRLRATLTYVSTHYLDNENKFDWFLFGPIMQFLVVENLRYLIQMPEVASSAGTEDGVMVMSSTAQGEGGTFLLHRSALKALVEQLIENDCCSSVADNPVSPETVGGANNRLRRCAADFTGIDLVDTRDHSGREMFLHCDSGHEEEECDGGDETKVSPKAVSLAVVKTSQDMERLYHLLYSCPRDFLPGVY